VSPIGLWMCPIRKAVKQRVKDGSVSSGLRRRNYSEKGKNSRGLTATGPEMDVGNPCGPIAVRATSYHELSV